MTTGCADKFTGTGTSAVDLILVTVSAGSLILVPLVILVHLLVIPVVLLDNDPHTG